MKDLIFWSKWTTPTKILYSISLGLFLSSIVYFLAYYFIGIGAILDWDVEYDIKNVTNTLEIFRHKLFDIPVDTENFVVLQYFKASLVKINYLSASIFLGLTVFAACLGLTVVTTYKNILWFIPGSALFAAWLASFKLDLLGVFGQNDGTLLAVMLFVYLGLSYIFHSLYTKISFLKRFLSFALVTVIFALVIGEFSTVSSPIMYMANFGLVVPAIISVLFICIIGYEISHLALSVMTMSKNSNPWSIPLNFLIVTVLYVGNIIVYYLYLDGEITWTLPYNVYLFYPICGVLGIWSHRKRSVLYTDVIPYAPGGAFLYLTFGIVSFATVGYLLSISLTPAIKVFEYIFFTSQISFGIAFFAYALRNFYKPMVHNMPVYKMVFDPKLMTHWALRGGAIVMMVFFVGKKMLTTKAKLDASYSNLRADAYLSDGQRFVAIKNYQEALEKYPGGHHASYSLASIYMKENNFGEASNILKSVNPNEASEYLYASLSAAYKGSSQSMKDLLILQDGARRFPNSPYIANNLGLAFHEINFPDSALFYLNKASESSEKEVINANFIGIAALDKIGDGSKVLEIDESLIDSKSYMANVYALSNALHTKPNKQFDVTKLGDDNVTGVELSLVNNYIDNNISNVPKALNTKLQYWVDSVIYDINLDNARFTLGKSYVYNDEIGKGLALLEYLTKHATQQQYMHYSNFTGLMQMKAGMYSEAYENLAKADEAMQLSDQNFARENTAIAALEVFDTAYADVLFRYLARKIPEKRRDYTIISETINGEFDSTDLHKSIYLVFHPESEKENPFSILKTYQDQNLKAMTIAELLNRGIESKHSILVEKLWEEMPESIEDEKLYQTINLLTLKTHQVFGDFTALENDLPNLDLARFDDRWKTFFEAKIAESKKDTEKAEQLYVKSLKSFPRNENIWGEAIDFYINQKDSEKAYDLCSDYLQKYGSTKDMLKKYVDLAITNNLYSFATDALEEMQIFMTEEEYRTYFESYKEVLGIEEIIEDEVQDENIY